MQLRQKTNKGIVLHQAVTNTAYGTDPPVLLRAHRHSPQTEDSTV